MLTASFLSKGKMAQVIGATQGWNLSSDLLSPSISSSSYALQRRAKKSRSMPREGS